MDLFNALPKDADRLTEISLASKRYWDYPEEWIQLWMDGLTISSDYIKDNYVYKAVVDYQIVGFCAIEEENNAFEVGHLWVDPKDIGKGIGKFLLNETLKNVLTKGEEIKVLADPNAVSFYEKQGFELIGEVDSLPKGRKLPLMKMVY